jgi:hypothetical protein
VTAAQPIPIEWRRGAPVMNAKIAEVNGRPTGASNAVAQVAVAQPPHSQNASGGVGGP